MAKLKTYSVVANPFHGEPDHNHRSNGAVPWDPEHHNPDRGWVGAQLRLDEDGERYFEFEQFDHELNLDPDFKPIEIPAESPLGKSAHYTQALRLGQLLPADEKTHKRARVPGDFVEPHVRLDHARAAHAAEIKRRQEAEEDDELEAKPRPKKGEGLLGPAHARRTLASCVVAADGKDAKGLLRAAVTTKPKTTSSDSHGGQ